MFGTLGLWGVKFWFGTGLLRLLQEFLEVRRIDLGSNSSGKGSESDTTVTVNIVVVLSNVRTRAANEDS